MSDAAVLPRILTHHAAARYRLRHDRDATDEDVLDALQAGAFQSTTPIWLQAEKASDGVVMVPGGCFRVAVTEHELVALTFISRPKFPKADRRAYQQQHRSPFT